VQGEVFIGATSVPSPAMDNPFNAEICQADFPISGHFTV